MAALLAFLLLALPVKPVNPGAEGGSPAPREEARFVFAWRGVPVGMVTLKLSQGHFTYASQHLHTRDGQPGERRREVTLAVDAAGRVKEERGAKAGEAGRMRGSGVEAGEAARGPDAKEVVPQSLWLWRGPPAVGCVVAREELSGREGPHCVTRTEGHRVEGTLLGAPFRASYGESGRLEALEVGDSRFTAAAPDERLRAPPELFAQGLPVEGTRGPLTLEPPLPVPERLEAMTPWEAGAAKALAARVHAAFTDKAPGAADWNEDGEGEAGGCLAHALRFAARARERGVKVALVHGLLVVDGGPARPHAWVRVSLARGGTLDLDPTSLDAVRPDTHLPLALADARGPALEAGQRWLALLRGAHRVVRRP